MVIIGFKLYRSNSSNNSSINSEGDIGLYEPTLFGSLSGYGVIIISASFHSISVYI